MIKTLYLAGTTFRQSNQMVCMTCCTCHVLFAMTKEHDDLCLERGLSFYCPNGHCMSYNNTENQRLKKELDEQRKATERERRWRESAQADRDHEKRSKNAYRGQLTKVRNRIKNGVCPCCNRHFTNLERHMATKHPSFQAEVPEPTE